MIGAVHLKALDLGFLDSYHLLRLCGLTELLLQHILYDTVKGCLVLRVKEH